MKEETYKEKPFKAQWVYIDEGFPKGPGDFVTICGRGELHIIRILEKDYSEIRRLFVQCMVKKWLKLRIRK